MLGKSIERFNLLRPAIRPRLDNIFYNRVCAGAGFFAHGRPMGSAELLMCFTRKLMNAVIVREPQNAVFLSKLASQYLIRNGRFDVVAGKAARDGPLDDYFAIDLRIPHAVDPYTIIELRDDKVECRKVSIVRLFRRRSPKSSASSDL